MPKVLEKENLERKILAEVSDVKRELRELRRIVIGKEEELTEEDVLKIVEEGDHAYREGRIVEHDEFIKKEYPQYAHLLHRDHSKVSKSLPKVTPRS